MLDRRSLLLTGTAAASAGALGLPALAKAPMLGAARPSYRRFAHGAFEVTTLLDGAVPSDGPAAAFGVGAAEGAPEALLAENNLPTEAAEFTFMPVLVNTGDSLVLFDTGNGEGARPARGQLAAQIAAAGYSADQIDRVVITHFHPDHIGGILEGGVAAFPNADYAVGAVDYDFWNSEARVGTPAERIYQMVQALNPVIGERMVMMNPGDSVAPGIEAMAAFGHTPGHMVYHIESDGARLVLTADTANHFVLALQRPDWGFTFDIDKEAAAATRKEIFGMLAADKVVFTGYHMPFPALGYVSAEGDGFVYEPVSYQLNL
ncbi:MAG: MBL fold metallo-hydrolase [Pseudomonadota bacterium]